MSTCRAIYIAVTLVLVGTMVLARPTTAAGSSVPAATQATGFILLGEFSNEAELNAHFDPKAEPRQPYHVQLWKDEKAGIVGHIFYPVQEADSPVARIQDTAFDKASGKISFQGRIWAGNSFPENKPQYEIHTFTGVLSGDTLRGTFSRQDEGVKRGPVKEKVTLKRVPSGKQLAPDGLKTLSQWESEYSRLVTGRQPK
jgi:hypothetical protein